MSSVFTVELTGNSSALGNAVLSLNTARTTLAFEVSLEGIDVGSLFNTPQTPTTADNLIGANILYAGSPVFELENAQNLVYEPQEDGSAILTGSFSLTEADRANLSALEASEGINLSNLDDGEATPLSLNILTTGQPNGAIQGIITAATVDEPEPPDEPESPGVADVFAVKLSGDGTASGDAVLSLDPARTTLAFEVSLENIDVGSLFNTSQTPTTADDLIGANILYSGSPIFELENAQNLVYDLQEDGLAVLTGSFSLTEADRAELSALEASEGIDLSNLEDGEATPLSLNILTTGQPNGAIQGVITAATDVNEPEPPGDIVDIVSDTTDTGLVRAFAYDTTSVIAGANISTRLTDDVQDLGTDAEFENLVGLYEVANAQGQINVDTNGDGVGDTLLNPGDEGYARAAIVNRVDNFRILAGGSGNPNANTTVEEFGDVLLSGGKFYAPFVIANGGSVGFDDFIVREDAETDGVFNDAADFREDLVAYFAFVGANPDGIEHLQARGNQVFGFEDLPGGGDLDFNDAVFSLDFTV